MSDEAQHDIDPAVGPRGRSAEYGSTRPSDVELLGRVRRGDRAAFEELFDRFVAPVHGLVLAVIPDAERAAKVVTELFVDLWQSPSHLLSTPGAAPSGFSTRILAAAHRRAVQDVRLHRQDSDVEDSPARRVSRPVARALEGIPDPAALAAVQLAYFDARTLGELAARMEVPMNTVVSLLNRGLEGLRGSAR